MPTINVAHTRISPPADLEPEAAKVFRSVVNSVSAQHIIDADISLLVEYARAVVQSGLAQRQMAEHGQVLDGKPSPWFAIWKESVRAIGGLSVRLRIGPQARHDREAAGRHGRDQGPRGIEALLNHD
jgi:phage terminase small subunit